MPSKFTLPKIKSLLLLFGLSVASIGVHSDFKIIQEFIVTIIGLNNQPTELKIKNMPPKTTLKQCIEFAKFTYPQINTTDLIIIGSGCILKPKDFKRKLVSIPGLIQPFKDNDFDNGKGYVNIHISI